MRCAALILMLLGSGCAGALGEPESPVATHDQIDAALSARSRDSPDHGAHSSVIADETSAAPGASRSVGVQRVVIGEPRHEAPRPRRAHSVDVSFYRADLENAFRFLADAGRFNLVVEAGLTGNVTATLRRVDAYDALCAIASANGAEARFEQGIVVVRRR